MNINFEYYKIFYIIAKNKNISKAAKELNISQPALSRMLKTLERQLETTLFIRDKKGVNLTNEGQILYNQVGVPIENIINAEDDIKKLTSDKNIKISVDSAFLNNYLISKLKPSFFKENKITFLDIKSFDELNHKILNNAIDCAIVSNNSHYKFDEAIKFVEIIKLHGCLISKTKIKDINNNIKFILPNYKSGFRKYIEPFCNKHSINISNNIEAFDYNSIVNLINSGIGIGFVIEEFIKKELNTKELFKITLPEEMNYIEFYFIYKKEKQFNQGIQAILNQLTK